MTIETNRDQASTLLRVALEDNELGCWKDALEHAQDAVAFLSEIAFEQSLASLDRKIRGMESEDIEELLQSGGMK